VIGCDTRDVSSVQPPSDGTPEGAGALALIAQLPRVDEHSTTIDAGIDEVGLR
jgi:hypothetical protein